MILGNEMNLSEEELIEGLLSIASQHVLRGPGYAQEGVVLRQARNEFGPKTLAHEQRILEAWQRLFIDGELSWGYDLDTPSAPFFHLAVHNAATPAGAR